MRSKNKVMSATKLKNLINCTPLLSRRVTPTWQPLQSDEPTAEEATTVPEDVTEGHFAVLAATGGADTRMRRFVIGLNHLKNPDFLRLLDQAQEEYGFQNDGVLVVPCKAEELEMILADSM